MFSLDNNTRIFIGRDPVDMRKSFNGLHGVVMNQLQMDPLAGHFFVFRNRNADRIKILHWDGNGLWVCAKRLDRGQFRWPACNEQSLSLTKEQLRELISEVNFKRI